MMVDPMRLADLVCARLCHDLSGPLGTVMGSAELAGGNATLAAEALTLLGDAAGELGRRLALFRAAWTDGLGPLSAEQIAVLAAGLPAGRKLRVDLSGLDPAIIFPAAVGRVLLNVLLLAQEALPRGGMVSLSGGGAGDVLAEIAGRDAAWPAALGEAMANPEAGWTAVTGPRAIVAPLTIQIARDAAVGLSFLLSSNPAATAPPPLRITFPPRA